RQQAVRPDAGLRGGASLAEGVVQRCRSGLGADQNGRSGSARRSKKWSRYPGVASGQQRTRSDGDRPVFLSSENPATEGGRASNRSPGRAPRLLRRPHWGFAARIEGDIVVN